jgi:hypothetical protein
MKMRRTQPFYLGHPAKPMTCIEAGVASSKKEGADGDTQLRKPDNCNPGRVAIIHMQREFQELYVSLCLDRTAAYRHGLESFFHCLHARMCTHYDHKGAGDGLEKAKENREINHEKKTEGRCMQTLFIFHTSPQPCFLLAGGSRP